MGEMGRCRGIDRLQTPNQVNNINLGAERQVSHVSNQATATSLIQYKKETAKEASAISKWFMEEAVCLAERWSKVWEMVAAYYDA